MVRTAVGSDDEGPFDPRFLAQLQSALDAARPNLDAIVGVQKMLDAALPKFDLTQLARVQGMLDAALPKFDAIIDVQRMLDQAVPTMTPLTHIQTTIIEAARPRFDAIVDTQKMLDLALPQFGRLAVLENTAALQDLLASTIPDFDVSELAGFDRIAEGLAPTINLDYLSNLARHVEQMLPDVEFDRLPDLIDRDLLRWAVSVEVDGESAGNGEDRNQGEALREDEARERLGAHLEAVERWLFLVAAQLRAGMVRMNRAVDGMNLEVGRYQQLAANLLFLYVALRVLLHVL